MKIIDFFKKLFYKSPDEKLFKSFMKGAGEKLTAKDWLAKVPNDTDTSLIRYMSKIFPKINFETFKAPNSLWSTFYAKIDEEKFTAEEYFDYFFTSNPELKLSCKTDEETDAEFRKDWLDFAFNEKWSKNPKEWNYRLSEQGADSAFREWMKEEDLEFIISLQTFVKNVKNLVESEFVNYLKEIGSYETIWHSNEEWEELLKGFIDYKKKIGR